MSVRRLDSNGDWTFGRGLANYIKRGAEIRQNVVTRIKSFKHDWFLDIEANIDWLNILSQRENQVTILREIRRVVLNTPGVKTILNLEVLEVTQRRASLLLRYTTIYDDEFLEQIGVEANAT